jgi:YesN/AraC family two-component response regulator
MWPRAAAGPILIVEDDPQARSFFTSLVAERFPGYGIRTAEDGEAALTIMAHEVPSLVLLDLIMPQVDGFQVLRQMRAEERTSRIPVLIMTGHLLSIDDVKRLEQYALITVHSKGILSTDEISAALQRSLFGTDTLPAHTSALVKRTIAYFHQNYAEPLTRGEVASAIGVSENYLSQIFHRELGLPPWDYLTRYRIRQAEQLLRCTTESITAIATRVGFQDSGYFGRVFRRETGMSPTVFRAS